MVKLKLISNILFYSFIFLAIIFFLKNPRDLYPPLTLFFNFILLIALKFFILKLNDIEVLFVSLAYWASTLGEYFMFNFYQRFYYYDKFLHFIIVFFLMLIIYRRLKVSGLKKNIGFFSILVSLGFASIWEINEFLYDLIWYFKMQGVFNMNFYMKMSGLQDTMWDLIAGLGASIFAWLIILLYNKFKKKQEKT